MDLLNQDGSAIDVLGTAQEAKLIASFANATITGLNLEQSSIFLLTNDSSLYAIPSGALIPSPDNQPILISSAFNSTQKPNALAAVTQNILLVNDGALGITALRIDTEGSDEQISLMNGTSPVYFSVPLEGSQVITAFQVIMLGAHSLSAITLMLIASLSFLYYL